MDATQLTKTADPAAARSSVEPLYYGRTLSTGESVMAHADGVANILRAIRNDPELISAAYLFSVPTLVQKPDEWIEKSFGENVAGLVRELGKMNDLSKRARSENKESSAAGAARGASPHVPGDESGSARRTAQIGKPPADAALVCLFTGAGRSGIR